MVILAASSVHTAVELRHDCDCLSRCTGGAGAPSGPKKKKIMKLSRKQMQRKALKKSRGEALVDRREKKGAKDARRLDMKLAAKAMW